MSRMKACRSGASGVVLRGVEGAIADAIGDRPHQTALNSGRIEDRADEKAARRLAVGAGDADDAHLAAGVIEELR